MKSTVELSGPTPRAPLVTSLGPAVVPERVSRYTATPGPIGEQAVDQVGAELHHRRGTTVVVRATF